MSCSIPPTSNESNTTCGTNSCTEKPKKSRLQVYEAPVVTDTTTIVEMAQHYPEAWKEVFVDENGEVYPDIVHVQNILQKKGHLASVQPPVEKIFRAFERLRPEDVRVILLGQDPFYTGVATGLSFSVEKGVAIPSSLQNIYKELSQCDPKIVCPNPVDIEQSRWVPPNHGDLTEWESRGVLMLNRCLTTVYGKAAAHCDARTGQGPWDGFTKRVLRFIIKKTKESGRTVVFLLLGKIAQGVTELLEADIISVEAAHPSGRSAAKYGFFGSRVFEKVNQKLIEHGERAINWQITRY